MRPTGNTAAEQEQRREQSLLFYSGQKQRAAMGEEDLSAKQGQLVQKLASANICRARRTGWLAEALKDKITGRSLAPGADTAARDAQTASAGAAGPAGREQHPGAGTGTRAYTRELQMGGRGGAEGGRAALRLRRKQIDQFCGVWSGPAGQRVYDDACGCWMRGKRLSEGQRVRRWMPTQETAKRDRLRQAFAERQEKNVRLTLLRRISTPFIRR